MSVRHRVLLAQLAEGALPTEFLLFRAGVNATTKGDVLFDDAAAASVMAAYQAQGVDLMIDLEHEALDKPIRPDSRDARGWFQLQLRGGDLWAVNVRWAPDGARRLTEKTQRYTSPAFWTDESGRVTEIVNCALVAMPATHKNAPLVAASRGGSSPRGCAPPAACNNGGVRPRRASKKNMSPEIMKNALEVLAAEDGAKALEILKQLITEAAAGAPPPADGGGEALADNAEVTPPAPGEDPKLTARLAKLEADAAERNKATLARLAKLEAEAAQADAAERSKLVGDLVKLGAETPATAYGTDPAKRVLCKRLSAEPIEDLRDRVTALSAANPKRGNLEADTTAPDVAEAVKRLSKTQLEQIKKAGMTPEEFIQKRSAAVRRA